MKHIYFLTGMALGACVGGLVVYKNTQLRNMMKEKEAAIMKKLDKARENVADFIAPEDDDDSQKKGVKGQGQGGQNAGASQNNQTSTSTAAKKKTK